MTTTHITCCTPYVGTFHYYLCIPLLMLHFLFQMIDTEERSRERERERAHVTAIQDLDGPVCALLGVGDMFVDVLQIPFLFLLQNHRERERGIE